MMRKWERGNIYSNNGWELLRNECLDIRSRIYCK